MKILGGPGAVAAFARSIGDRQFRLDRSKPLLIQRYRAIGGTIDTQCVGYTLNDSRGEALRAASPGAITSLATG